MPFIINHIDNVLLAVEIAIKVSKFLVKAAKLAAKVAHFTALFIGGMLIIGCQWAIECHQHVSGKTVTHVDTAISESNHPIAQAPHQESAPAPEVAPEQFASEPLVAIVNPVLAKDWVLDTDAIDKLPIKPKRGGQAKAPREKVAA